MKVNIIKGVGHDTYEPPVNLDIVLQNSSSEIFGSYSYCPVNDRPVGQPHTTEGQSFTDWLWVQQAKTTPAKLLTSPLFKWSFTTQ